MTGPNAAPVPASEEGELAPALQAKLAQQAKFLPAGSLSYQEGERSQAAEDDWDKHATPGDEIPSAVLAEARRDWTELRGRNKKGSGDWRPLGPTWAKGLPNAFRDRSVYNAGTPDFSGRIAHVAIDPNCGSRACRLWIANANGGVWRTDDALGKKPEWKYLSQSFEHNNTASIELDPNDSSSNTVWVGTGEPNACGSGCGAGVLRAACSCRADRSPGSEQSAVSSASGRSTFASAVKACPHASLSSSPSAATPSSTLSSAGRRS